MKSSAVEFRLPFPMSVNNLFTGRQRRYPSPRYKAWQQEAGWQMHRQRVRPVEGRVNVELILTPPDKRKRDADNYAKSVMDLMVKLRVIEADSADVVRGVLARWADEPGTPGAVVRITPA